MWLTRMPSALVRACLQMLPRLEAEESVLAANRYKVGSGTLPKEQHDAIAGAWEQQADRPRPKADPSALVAHGFQVRKVKGRKRSKRPVPATT